MTIRVGDGLDRFNAWIVYALGRALGDFRCVLVQRQTESVFALMDAQRMVRTFLLHCRDIFPDAVEPAQAFCDALDGIVDRVKAEFDGAAKFSARPTSDESHALLAHVEELERFLGKNMGRAHLYFVSQKRAYDMDLLMERAEEVLSGAAQRYIKARGAEPDMRLAGRAIAFGMPTAAGFHLFRVIEAAVLGYYELWNLPRPTGAERNLGRYINTLRDRGAKETVTAMLNHLREHHRNPLMHPEVILTPDQAETLFGLTQAILGSITEDVARLSGKLP